MVTSGKAMSCRPLSLKKTVTAHGEKETGNQAYYLDQEALVKLSPFLDEGLKNIPTSCLEQ